MEIVSQVRGTKIESLYIKYVWLSSWSCFEYPFFLTVACVVRQWCIKDLKAQLLLVFLLLFLRRLLLLLLLLLLHCCGSFSFCLLRVSVMGC